NSAQAARLLDELLARFPDAVSTVGASAGFLYEPVMGTLSNGEKLLEILEAGVRALPSAGGLRNFYGYALLWKGRPAEEIREIRTYIELSAREPNPYDSSGDA